MTPADLTLVLMLKAPRPGTVKTRLAKDLGNERATEIYKQLVERQASQLPAEFSAEVHYAPSDAEPEFREWLGDGFGFRAQCGGDLGERLIHAARNVFDNGASALVFLGGDCPHVTADHLRECGRLLEAHDVVLGPARDGGYYLIGIKRLDPRLFEGIDWGTETVLEQTLERITEVGLTVFQLEELEDVDDLGSWQRAEPLLRKEYEL